MQATRAVLPRRSVSSQRGSGSWLAGARDALQHQAIVRVEQNRQQPSRSTLVLRLTPRHLSHILVGLVVAAVFIGSTSTRTADAVEAIRSWTFEPFNSQLRSGDYLAVHPQLGGGLQEGTGRSGVFNYTVQFGDTLSGIANTFGVSTQTVLWANELSDGNFIQPGDALKIPPVSGVLHTVVAGDRLAELAKKYGVEQDQVLNFPLNKIQDPESLISGQVVMFPGGVRPRPPAPITNAGASGGGGGTGGPPPSAAIVRGSRLGWPTGGFISQYFSASHLGLDIAAPMGSTLYAVEDGEVVVAAFGWNGGYGTVIDIEHEGGLVSRYSHLDKLYVTRGQQVRRGQAVGTIGVTGITTGPHIHFEILQNGRRLNPLVFLN